VFCVQESEEGKCSETSQKHDVRTVRHVGAEVLLVRHAGAQQDDRQPDVARVLHLLPVQLLVAIERHLAGLLALHITP